MGRSYVLPGGDETEGCNAGMRRFEVGVDDILRFPTPVEHEPAVDEWLRARRAELRPLAEAWFESLRSCGDAVRELMHDGRPTACVGDAAFGYIAAYRDHVNVEFFFGALLEERRHRQARPPREAVTRSADRSGALVRLVTTAYVDIKVRLRR